MSEMIERVAKALYRAELPDRTDAEIDEIWQRSDWEPMREAMRTRARAVIEAMREPTEAMDNAAARLTGVSPGMADAGWRAMIGAATLDPS